MTLSEVGKVTSDVWDRKVNLLCYLYRKVTLKQKTPIRGVITLLRGGTDTVGNWLYVGL